MALMKKLIIPGHFKASTLFLIVIALLVAYLDHRYTIVIYENRFLGLILVLAGAFFVDQATHLAQKDHSSPPPTLIETIMQDYRWPSVIVGFIALILGVLIL